MLDQHLQDFGVENNFDFSSSKKVYTILSLPSIVLPQNQPRKYFDSERLLELAESIRQNGILKPLIVRHISQSKEKYELVTGERRYRAAKEAGLTEVPVFIYHLSNEEAIAISLCENLQREDLNPVEETEGILTLLSLKLKMTTPDVIALLYRMRNEANNKVSQNVLTNTCGQTIKAVFDSLGKISWESFITSRLPLLKLPEDILEVLRSGKIAYTKAIAIASIKKNKLRQALIEEAVSQNLSLSQIRKKIKNYNYQDSPASTWEQKAKTTRTYQAAEETSAVLSSLKRLVKSRLWENPTKKQQVEQLLLQLEELLSK